MEKNERLHELIIQVVNNQLEAGKPEATVIAYDAFQKLGLSEEESKQMIGAALLSEIYRMMTTGDEFDEDRYIDTLMEMLRGEWSPYEQGEIPEHLTLKDALLIGNDTDLLNMLADDYFIEPSEDEENTAADIAAFLLKPQKMKEMILALREGTPDLISRMIAHPDMELSEEERELLSDCGDLEDCLLFADDGRILVPEDVAELWQNVYTEAFEEKRRKYVWLRSCLETAAYYYGVFDINVLMNLTGQNTSFRLNQEEVYDLLDEMPVGKILFVRYGERFIERDLVNDDNWKELLSVQRDCPFVIPSEQEIRDIDFYHYPYHETGWKDLREQIQGTEFDFIADDVLPIAFHRVITGGDEEEIENILRQERVMPDEDDFGGIWTLITGNTRMLALRGGKRSEGKQPGRISEDLFDTLLTLEERMEGDEPEEDFQQMYS